MRDTLIIDTIETTGADGEVQLVARAPDAPRPHAPRMRDHAWAVNPVCLECARPIAGPDAASLVPLPEGPRVAHTHTCFVRAIARTNPTFTQSAARRRAEDSQ